MPEKLSAIVALGKAVEHRALRAGKILCEGEPNQGEIMCAAFICANSVARMIPVESRTHAINHAIEVLEIALKETICVLADDELPTMPDIPLSEMN